VFSVNLSWESIYNGKEQFTKRN